MFGSNCTFDNEKNDPKIMATECKEWIKYFSKYDESAVYQAFNTYKLIPGIAQETNLSVLNIEAWKNKGDQTDVERLKIQVAMNHLNNLRMNSKTKVSSLTKQLVLMKNKSTNPTR